MHARAIGCSDRISASLHHESLEVPAMLTHRASAAPLRLHRPRVKARIKVGRSTFTHDERQTAAYVAAWDGTRLGSSVGFSGGIGTRRQSVISYINSRKGLVIRASGAGPNPNTNPDPNPNPHPKPNL